MCGVIGVSLKKVTDTDLEMVGNVFRESMIRGKHATGITYLKDKTLTTIKKPIPATEFLEEINFKDFVDRGNLRLIGHIRYSTSDLRYNQPFQNEVVSIAHNGVISQDPDNWEFETETGNDSELILRAFEQQKHPLRFYADRSMAVIRITHNALVGFRNHERPLWYSEVDNGVVFASTQNILSRAGLDNTMKCEPFVEYVHAGFQMVQQKYFENMHGDLQ